MFRFGLAIQLKDRMGQEKQESHWQKLRHEALALTREAPGQAPTHLHTRIRRLAEDLFEARFPAEPPARQGCGVPPASEGYTTLSRHFAGAGSTPMTAALGTARSTLTSSGLWSEPILPALSAASQRT